MVLRKPQPYAAAASLITDPTATASASLPYPTTPPDRSAPGPPPEYAQEVYSPSLHHSPTFNFSTLNEAQESSGHVSYGMDPGWGSEVHDDGKENMGLPTALRAGEGRLSSESIRSTDAMPNSLRVGPPEGTPRTSGESQRSEGTRQKPLWASAADTPKPEVSTNHTEGSTNPFVRAQIARKLSQDNREVSSADAWGDASSHPPPPPREPPPAPPSEWQYQQEPMPVREIDHLTISDQVPNQYPSSTIPTNPYNNNSQYHQTRSSIARQDSIPISPNEDPSNSGLIPVSPPSRQAPCFPSSSETFTHGMSQGGDLATSPGSEAGHHRNSSLGWDPGMDISTFDGLTSRNHGLPQVGEEDESQPVHQTWEEQKIWEHNARERRERDAAVAVEQARLQEQERLAEEEWNKGEEEALQEAELAESRAARGDMGGYVNRQPTDELRPDLPPRPEEQEAPELPPRRTMGDREQSPAILNRTRLAVMTGGSPSNAGRDTPGTTAKKQRSETYQIKQINWFDASSRTNPRRSPILVQNANGPCPLLALVNALVLSTPAGVETALVETLRTREQVSLGLLLDAVFDELMSGRRGGAAQELPDVGDLYTFLITLHAGMNVNPRFVTLDPKAPNLMDAPEDLLISVHDAPINSSEAGGFEETREMRLYSTFSIPLIHGWLPPKEYPAYIALSRSAKTYEDAQNVQFYKDELEDKSQRAGLTNGEQILLEDVTVIEQFLSQSATQLTNYGLETMTRALSPGSIAILFRNDHFSTLYKHPRSGQLLTLVTDMGYSGHDEVVWESLVDVSGEGCEFFAGDFRPVGNVSGDTRSRDTGKAAESDAVPQDGGNGWNTVNRSKSRRKPVPGISQQRQGNGNGNVSSGTKNNGGPSSGYNDSIPVLSNDTVEQEDHDLALALQLQEEEEDRHRREQAARRHEDDLSREFLAQQADITEPNPTSQSGSPAMLRGRARGQNNRPSAPSRDQPPADAPPPSYEQAASGRPYHPPPNHPAHPASSPTGSRPAAHRRQLSAYAQNAELYRAISPTTPIPTTPQQQFQASRRTSGRSMTIREQGNSSTADIHGGPPAPRRRTSAGVSASEEDKKDCIVM
ncbi:MAG: hypothetical protein M1827_003513 [Pycnora praestabilis]|nr:MAG: hypothetical protein M1827_003513 [Pycnora praestabilis]